MTVRSISRALAAMAALLVLAFTALNPPPTAAQERHAPLEVALSIAADGVAIELPELAIATSPAFEDVRVQLGARAGRVVIAGVETSPPGTGFPSPLHLAPFLIGMTALSKDRDTPRRDGRLTSYLVGAGKRIYAGALVVLSGGYAEGGRTALNLQCVGRANAAADNSAGAAGDLSVLVERGVFRFAQDGTITQADVGGTCYIVDDQTVADNDGAGTRSAAGTIRGVETGGVWVEI